VYFTTILQYNPGSLLFHGRAK